jgi:hypothetical protein
MQEAAVGLLDAAIVSNPPHYRRRTQAARMSAMADDLPDEPENGTLRLSAAQS